VQLAALPAADTAYLDCTMANAEDRAEEGVNPESERLPQRLDL